MKMLTIGPVEGTVTAFSKRLEQAVPRWDAAPKLAILFLPWSADHEKYIEVTQQFVRAPVVGATTGGAAFTERGHSHTGAVCALLGGDNLEVECALATNVRANPPLHISHALRSLDVGRGRHTSLLVLADAFACDGEVLVTELRNHTPPHCKIFGGTAGDDWTFRGSKVFYDKHVASNAAVFVALHPQQRLHVDVRHGWQIAEGSHELTVTHVEGNVVRTLNGSPAAEVYREELRRLGFLSESESLLSVIAKHDLGVKTPFGEQLKIRAPLGIGADGSITLASSLRQGDVVHVVTTTPERLIDAAKSLSSRVIGPFAKPSGSLVFDCASRLQLLGEHYGEEVRAFHGAGLHPMAGMACYGEIAKFGGSVEGFHNTTAVMVGW